MQAPTAAAGQVNEDPPPPPPYAVSHTISSSTPNQQCNTSGLRCQTSNDGELAESVAPRQEPQGEESKLQEATSPKFSQHHKTYNNQYTRPPNTSEEQAVSIRHKPQSNSVPVQSSQFIQHGVKQSQSRSLDSTNSQIDSKTYAISVPQYRAPPTYGSTSMQERQASNGLAQHAAVPRNGSNVTVGAAYNQGGDMLLPPPPEYPGNRADVRRSYEVLDRVASTPNHTGSLSQSCSQPELANVITTPSSSQALSASNGVNSPQRHSSTGNRKQFSADQQQDFAAIAARASQMVEILSEENKSLRNELECYYRKVSKLQKFETELQKVHEAYENLVKSCAKRESLEKAIRVKQDMDIKQLEEAERQSEEKVLVLESRLGDQTSLLGKLSKLVSQHEETITHLTKLTSEQKEMIHVGQSTTRDLTNELEYERSQSKMFAEELEAYKSNASITMEEESEVKMAALTQSTKDSERIIHEEQAEKLTYMDEAHQACKKVALLEAKLKALEASCAEKDAVVRVLQRRQRSNLSGRGQTCTTPNPGQHARRISEPSSSLTDRASPLPLDSSAEEQQRFASNECLQTQTWQV